MSAGVYSLIPQDDSGTREKSALPLKTHSLSARCKSLLVLLGGLLLGSLSLNTLLLYHRFLDHGNCTMSYQPSMLRRDVPRDIVPPHEFSSLNRTVQDSAWEHPNMNAWELFVALEEGYVVAQGLPHAQRWPWDLSKGVYIPIAAHELHCAVILRIYINKLQDGVPEDELTWDYAHSIHCLNLLRDSVMCNADDQLMYTGRLHDNLHHEEAEPGRGTIKMCRSWDRFRDWAQAHSACYLSINRKDPTFPDIERYKYCPDGSKLWESL